MCCSSENPNFYKFRSFQKWLYRICLISSLFQVIAASSSSPSCGNITLNIGENHLTKLVCVKELIVGSSTDNYHYQMLSLCAEHQALPLGANVFTMQVLKRFSDYLSYFSSIAIGTVIKEELMFNIDGSPIRLKRRQEEEHCISKLLAIQSGIPLILVSSIPECEVKKLNVRLLLPSSRRIGVVCIAHEFYASQGLQLSAPISEHYEMSLPACRSFCRTVYDIELHYVVIAETKCYCQLEKPISTHKISDIISAALLCANAAQLCGSPEIPIVYSSEIYPNPSFASCDEVKANGAVAVGWYSLKHSSPSTCLVGSEMCPSPFKADGRHCMKYVNGLKDSMEASYECYKDGMSPAHIARYDDHVDLFNLELLKLDVAPEYIYFGLVNIAPGIVAWSNGAKLGYRLCYINNSSKEGFLMLSKKSRYQRCAFVPKDKVLTTPTLILCDLKQSLIGFISAEGVDASLARYVSSKQMSLTSCLHICGGAHQGNKIALLYEEHCSCAQDINFKFLNISQVGEFTLVPSKVVPGQADRAIVVTSFGTEIDDGILVYDIENFLDSDFDHCTEAFANGIQVSGNYPINGKYEYCHFYEDKRLVWQGKTLIMAKYDTREHNLETCIEEHGGVPATLSACSYDLQLIIGYIDAAAMFNAYEMAKVINEPMTGQTFWETGELSNVKSPVYCPQLNSFSEVIDSTLNRETGMICQVHETEVKLKCYLPYRLLSLEPVLTHPSLLPLSCIEYCRGKNNTYAMYTCLAYKKEKGCYCRNSEPNTTVQTYTGACLEHCVSSRGSHVDLLAVYNTELYDVWATTCRDIYEKLRFGVSGQYIFRHLWKDGTFKARCDPNHPYICEANILETDSWYTDDSILTVNVNGNKMLNIPVNMVLEQYVVRLNGAHRVRGLYIEYTTELMLGMAIVDIDGNDHKSLPVKEIPYTVEGASRVPSGKANSLNSQQPVVTSKRVLFERSIPGKTLIIHSFNSQPFNMIILGCVDDEPTGGSDDSDWDVGCISFDRTGNLLRLAEATTKMEAYGQCKDVCANSYFGIIAERRIVSVGGGMPTSSSWMCACVSKSDRLEIPTVIVDVTPEMCSSLLLPYCEGCLATTVRFWYFRIVCILLLFFHFIIFKI